MNADLDGQFCSLTAGIDAQHASTTKKRESMMTKIKYKIAVIVPGEPREPRYEIEAVNPTMAMVALQERYYRSWMGPYTTTDGAWALVSEFGQEINFDVRGEQPTKKLLKQGKPLWVATMRAKANGNTTTLSVRGKTREEAIAAYAKSLAGIIDLIELISINPVFMEGV